MGIQGLLPLLKDVSVDAHVSDFRGQVLGIDAYVWLHRGAYGCAQDLVLGRRTNAYINLAISRLRMLRYHGVIPYVVFDGDKLPAKAKTEDDRERRRAENLARAQKLLAEGKGKLAHDIFAKCIDVTPEMAYQLIKVLREMDIPYIVAPYEADAQLAYLEKKGTISGIVTEDSDLLIFGCKRVLFKLDPNGSCVAIERSKLSACRTLALAGFTDDDFRQMAILSGCDYLDSIPGVGLKVAHRYLRKYKTVARLLSAMRLEGNLKVPEGYAKSFALAERTFVYQHVFDRCDDSGRVRLANLNPLSDADRGAAAGEGGEEEAWSCIGPPMSDEEAQGIADGIIDPITRRKMVDIHPGPAKISRAASTSAITGTGTGSGGSTSGSAFKRSVTTSASFSWGDRKRFGAAQAKAAPEADGKQRKLDTFFKKAAPSPSQPGASKSRQSASSGPTVLRPSTVTINSTSTAKMTPNGILDSAAKGSSSVRLALFNRASQETAVASKFFGGGEGEEGKGEEDEDVVPSAEPSTSEAGPTASVEEEEQMTLAMNSAWDCDEVEMQPSSPQATFEEQGTPRQGPPRRIQGDQAIENSPDINASPDSTAAGRDTSESGALGSNAGQAQLISTPNSSIEDADEYRSRSPEASPLLHRRARKGAEGAGPSRARVGHWSFGRDEGGFANDGKDDGEEGQEEVRPPSFGRDLVEAFKFSPVAGRREAHGVRAHQVTPGVPSKENARGSLDLSQTPKAAKGGAGNGKGGAKSKAARPTLLFDLSLGGSSAGAAAALTGDQAPRRVTTWMDKEKSRKPLAIISSNAFESPRGGVNGAARPLPAASSVEEQGAVTGARRSLVLSDEKIPAMDQQVPHDGGGGTSDARHGHHGSVANAKGRMTNAVAGGRAQRTPLALSTTTSAPTNSTSTVGTRLDAFRFRPKA